MKREHLYYGVIAGGLAVVALVAVVSFWPKSEPPLDPPNVVAQRLQASGNTEERVRAARDFIRHGDAARVEIRSFLAQHQSFEPEVVVPLVQATGKTRDYRSLPTLLELVDHADPFVSAQAVVAAEKILGAEFGYSPYAPAEERARVIALIKQDYKNAGPQIEEFYRDQAE